jgi:hypothetical protein
VADPDDTLAGEDASVREAADDVDSVAEPFVWAETDIVAHLKLVQASGGAMPTYTYELSSGEICTIGSVLTSAVHVRVRSQDGPPRVATNPSGTAGVGVTDGPGQFGSPPSIDTPSPQQAPALGAACLPELERALETLRPVRTLEAEAEDLRALDETLMAVARDWVATGDSTWSDGEWWPGVQGAVADNEATISGSSFGTRRSGLPSAS